MDELARHHASIMLLPVASMASSRRCFPRILGRQQLPLPLEWWWIVRGRVAHHWSTLLFAARICGARKNMSGVHYSSLKRANCRE